MNPLRDAKPVRAVSSFGQGAALPMRAFGLLASRPKWWFLVLIPLAINLALFTLALVWGFTVFGDWLGGWLEGREAWYWDLFRTFIQVLFWLVVVVVVYIAFTSIALLIAAPFNDRLAELTERALGIALPPDARSLVHSVAAEALFAVLAEAKRLGIVLGVFVVLLPLHAIPIAGSVVYAVVSVYCAARFVALEFMSYAADRRHMGFSEKWAITRAHHGMCMGFGLVCLGLLTAPFVNVFVVPLSAIAGTMLFSRAAPERFLRDRAR